VKYRGHVAFSGVAHGSRSLSFSPVMFAMTICPKYHALANLEQNDIFIKGTIN
jgi:hypothetical protein